MPLILNCRQLEAIIRITESLAKMRLAPFATEADVDEALRLFQVSTLDAALSGNLAGAEGFTSEEEQELLNRIEKQMKRRFVIGSQVSEHAIIQDFVKQVRIESDGKNFPSQKLALHIFAVSVISENKNPIGSLSP